MIAVHIFALEQFVSWQQRIGKSAGKVDMGESASCSKIGLAHVRNGGVLPIKPGRRYLPCPCLGHAICGAGWGMPLVRPILLA